MSYAECIIFALGALGESADAVLGAVKPECLATTGYDLVSICLVTYVKYDLVQRRIIYIMKSDDEFHGSETWTKVARIDCTALDHILTDFLT